MNEQSKMERCIMQLAASLLNDELGISDESYKLLLELLDELPDSHADIRELLSRVDATDGRFYIA